MYGIDYVIIFPHEMLHQLMQCFIRCQGLRRIIHTRHLTKNLSGGFSVSVCKGLGCGRSAAAESLPQTAPPALLDPPIPRGYRVGPHRPPNREGQPPPLPKQLPRHDCQLHQQQHHRLRPAAAAAAPRLPAPSAAAPPAAAPAASRLPFRLAPCPALRPLHRPASILQASSPDTPEDFAKVMFCEVFLLNKSSNT